MNTKEFENNLGIYLRKRRKEMELTLQETADKLEVTQGYLSNVENGKRTPSINFITKIADLYAEPFIELVNRISKKTQPMLNVIETNEALKNPLIYPGYYDIINIRIKSMKTRLEIENESGISAIKQKMIERDGTKDIELLNKYGQVMGVNDLYGFISAKTKIPYVKWWGKEGIIDISEEEYASLNHKKRMILNKSLQKHENDNVYLDKILQNTKYLYFNDMLLTDAQRGKISRILETLFEDDM
ncbi:helix-turn-helix domain-containing protein [Paenisporosarcina sp. OV554]|uniref:helix-turn-helix domain-containing protein n=1 Tax=Paenisporosarcina sp. OV554 TaxID=2135694 RepID=UPI000D3AFC42|nr:helix-turn-helix transcriptional regulator [Paenisporosarcina sp. OV554]PUB18238.1 helix-turn-helix protein [Paenisporosarcina sp. OV554]